MGEFKDRLDELAATNSTVPPSKGSVIPGWEPGVRYNGDGSHTVTLPPCPPLDDSEWEKVVESFVGKIPDGYRVRLAEVKYDPAAWQRTEQFVEHPSLKRGIKTPATTHAVWRYRFVIEAAPARIPVDELLKAVKPRKTAPSPSQSGAVFVFAAGDLQIGKPDGDGSAGTVRRFEESLDRALTRYKALKKRGMCGPVLLPWLGDCIEGTESQGSKLLARLDLTVTEMVRVYRRLMLEQVQQFAALTDVLTVAVVPGNHDEAKRVGDQMATRYDDSWAIEGAVQVADVMKAKGYDLEWMFPGRDQMDLCLDVAGTRIGLLHGHQTKGKMQTWLAGQALNRRPIGTADVVLSGHFHTLRLEHLGPTTWMQTGALDGGSQWWTHRGGLESPPAALTFVAQDGRWSGFEVV